MTDKDLKNQLENLFSDMEEPSLAVIDEKGKPARPGSQARFDDEEQRATASGPNAGRERGVATTLRQPSTVPEPFPPGPATYHRRGVNWRLIIWSVLGTLAAIILVAYGQAIFSASSDQRVGENQPRFVVPLSPTPSATPSTTPTAQFKPFTFLEPTAMPTPAPGGQVLVLTPLAGDTGWVVSDDAGDALPNHFGDSFLYAGILAGKVYHAAIQFDLGQIPRGTTIYAASLRLTGLRADQLGQGGEWRLRLLASEIDYHWRSHNYEQIHNAVPLVTFEPALSPAQLGAGQINQFEFSPEQLAPLERRILEGSPQFGGKVSFRLDGPATGDDNLFAWDSGAGPDSRGAGPELFLSLGPPPLETPPPYYVVVTSTPTPENVMTAMANSLRMTAEATRVGTATPVPPNWVTPVVVTATPTPENQATARAMRRVATAIALTTGQPPNLAEATATPTYVIITSTPSPENVMTAVAEALQVTAQAAQFGPASPVPPNWVTPVVVTVTPTAENRATARAMRQVATAIALTTGQPPNLATATPTPTYVIFTSTPTPEDIMTAVAEALQVTAQAAQFGPATPFPPNWVTPVVVTSTPRPENRATVEHLKAVILTTGTPTPLPANAQTATSTPISMAAPPLASPTATATPSPTPQPVPVALLGKIVFLSDREGATEEERERAGISNVPPKISPQPYVYDPATGQLERLTARWPYDVAAARDSWSADTVYEAYTQQLLWTSVNRKPTEEFAIHYYDHKYKVEGQVTFFEAGVAWDPAWSPVRNQIAFVSNVSADDEIWVIDHDGSNPLQLTASNEAYNAREIGKDTFIPEVNGHPSWSPDGSQVVFWSNRTGNRQLWIMNLDGSDQRLLMGWDNWNPYNDWDPVWIKYLEPAPPLERQPDWRFIKPAEESR